MKIYFAGSIRAGREDSDVYLKIIEYLKKYGEVLSEHVGDKNLNFLGSKGDVKDIHRQDLMWLILSDVVIAEVSTPSLGVGYEIGRAVEHDKKILCLYKPQEGRSLSAMIAGCDKLTVKNYKNLKEAFYEIDNFIKKM